MHSTIRLMKRACDRLLSLVPGTYSYKGKYTINGTVRYEGSNKLGKSRLLDGCLHGISGAWNAHEEKFFESMKKVCQT